MNGVWLAAAAVVVPAIVCELALGGAKLQTALTRVVVAWTGSYAAALGWLVHYAGSGLAAVTIFWTGAFVLWFGVRSHLESSILLRMLVLLRSGAMTDAQLVDAYSSIYGESMRATELSRGGFVREASGRIRVTSKGRAILLLASKFR